MTCNDRFNTYYILEDTSEMPHKRFKQDDIITVTYWTTENNVTTKITRSGRISWIDTSFIEVDCSNNYKSCVVDICFKDIIDIG